MKGWVECEAYLGGTKWLPAERLQWRPAVYGVVLHEGRLLLVTFTRSGKYYLPGGAVEVGERLEAAVAREVLEETGIEVTVGSMIGFREGFSYFNPRDAASHSLNFFYHCTPQTFALREDAYIDQGEVERPQWVDVATLHPEDFHTDGPVILAQVTHLLPRP